MLRAFVQLEEAENFITLEQDDDDELAELIRLETSPPSRRDVAGGVSRFVTLEQDDDDDELSTSPPSRRDVAGVGKFITLEDLEGLDLDSLDGLSQEELIRLEQFEGFWSSITKPFKKAAKIVKGVVKIGTKGITQIPGLKEVAKVGKFIIQTPMLRRALAAATVPFTGPIGPALFEVAASMTQQAGAFKSPKGFLKAAGKAVAAGAGKAIALPAVPIKLSEIRTTMQAIHKSGPVGARIAQRLVRGGIPASLAARIVNPDPRKPLKGRISCPTKAEVQQMAGLASLALQVQTGETRGLPSGLRFLAT